MEGLLRDPDLFGKRKAAKGQFEQFRSELRNIANKNNFDLLSFWSIVRRFASSAIRIYFGNARRRRVSQERAQNRLNE